MGLSTERCLPSKHGSGRRMLPAWWTLWAEPRVPPRRTPNRKRRGKCWNIWRRCRKRPRLGRRPSAPRKSVRDGRILMQPQQTKVRADWLTSLQSLLVTVVIALFIVTFAVQAFQIPSESMEDTLLIGDYLLVDKLRYGGGGLGDTIMPY